jgi:hypothetical protein
VLGSTPTPRFPGGLPPAGSAGAGGQRFAWIALVAAAALLGSISYMAAVKKRGR